MTPFHQVVLLCILPFATGRADSSAFEALPVVPGATASVRQQHAAATSLDAAKAPKSSRGRLSRLLGEGGFWTKPETAADAEGEGGGRGREEGRWKSARASIGVVTEVAANVGSGARARARHFVCSDLRWAAGVVGSVAPGGFGGGFDGKDGSTGGGTRLARSLSFGNIRFPSLAPKEELEEEAVSPQMLMLQSENDASVAAVLAVIESEGWEHVTSKRGVEVVRKFMPPPPRSASSSARSERGVVDEAAAAKFACVKATGTLDAEAAEVFSLFLDNERVHEYNDNCRVVRDLERLSPDTKISWAATPKYGPFKARDFVTVVHYRTLDDGTMVVVNRAVEHPAARRGKKYVRAEILIASNIMRPNREDPTKTDFISVTHINPGGIADSTLGAKIVNKLCAKAPVNLLLALEKTANSPPVPKGTKRAA
eukprot:jgi/Undpi1/571/HiC_scaffold_10.g04035.m1